MTRTDVEAIFGVPAGRYDWAEPDSVMRFKALMALARFGQAQQPRETQIQHGIRFLNALEAVNEGGVSQTNDARRTVEQLLGPITAIDVHQFSPRKRFSPNFKDVER